MTSKDLMQKQGKSGDEHLSTDIRESILLFLHLQ